MNPIRLLLLLAALWIGTAGSAFALDLGDLVNLGGKLKKIVSEVTTEEEVEMGGNLISGLLGAAPLVDDDELQRYVNDVGYWVASRSSRRDLPWTFGVIDSDGINAFAAPGGYVVITRGLYELLENEAQLAGVLAHEISHVVRKHHLEALQKVVKREFWSDLTLTAVDNKKDRKKLGKLVNAGVQLYATGLDRKYEYEADLRGVVLAARSGYDPFALLDVLTTIDSINPDSKELSVMLNTHPPTGDRLTQLADRIDGHLDYYATGQANPKRFQQVSAAP
jgi:predicted Zn-dependent protease